MEIQTTIKAVLGRLPFEGTDGLDLNAYTRAAARTWLARCGWSARLANELDLDQLRAAYSDNGALNKLAGERSQPMVEFTDGQRHAEAGYQPRNEKLLAYLADKNAGRAPIIEDVQAEELPLTPRAPLHGGAAVNGHAKDDDAAELARLLAKLAGKSAAPLDEARVVELIQTHAPKPAEQVIRVEMARASGEVVALQGAQHPKAAILARAMAARMTNGYVPNIWIFGPTGSGKTHAAHQVADAMGLKFYLHGAMSMAHELMGFVDAAGNYHRTPFRDAFEHGGVALLDECDSYDQQVTLTANAALANGVASFPDGMIKRHPDCIVLAAGNTTGNGATADFVGRNKLDAAFLSRFPVKIEWPRDPAIEKAIAANDQWATRVMAARDRAQAAGVKHLIDPRHSQAGAALIAAGMSEDMAAELTYLAGLQDAQRRTVEGR